MDSILNSNFIGESLELTVNEKPKSKIYSTNFLSQFMKNSPKKESKHEKFLQNEKKEEQDENNPEINYINNNDNYTINNKDKQETNNYNYNQNLRNFTFKKSELNEVIVDSEVEPFKTALEFSPIKANDNLANSSSKENVNFIQDIQNSKKELFKDFQQKEEQAEKNENLLNTESLENNENKNDFDAFYDKVKKKNTVSHKLFSNIAAKNKADESSQNNHFETRRNLIENKKTNNLSNNNNNKNNDIALNFDKSDNIYTTNNKKIFYNLNPNFILNQNKSLKKQFNFANAKPKSKYLNLNLTKLKTSTKINNKQNNSKLKSENIQLTESSYAYSYNVTENYNLHNYNSKTNSNPNLNNNNENFENIQEDEKINQDVNKLLEKTSKSQDKDYIKNLLLNQNVVIVNNRYSNNLLSSKNSVNNIFKNLFGSKEKLLRKSKKPLGYKNLNDYSYNEMKMLESKSPLNALSTNNNDKNNIKTLQKKKSINNMLGDKVKLNSNNLFAKSNPESHYITNNNLLILSKNKNFKNIQNKNNNYQEQSNNFNFFKNKKITPNQFENNKKDTKKLAKSLNNKSKLSFNVIKSSNIESSKKQILRNLEKNNNHANTEYNFNLSTIPNDKEINSILKNYTKQNTLNSNNDLNPKNQIFDFCTAKSKKRDHLNINNNNNNHTHIINNLKNYDILYDYNYKTNYPRQFSSNKAYANVQPRYMISNPKRNKTVENLSSSGKKGNYLNKNQLQQNLVEYDSMSNKTNGIKNHDKDKSVKSKIRNKSIYSVNNSMNYNNHFNNRSNLNTLNNKTKNEKLLNENNISNLNGKSNENKKTLYGNKNYNFSLSDKDSDNNNKNSNKSLNYNTNKNHLSNYNNLPNKVINNNENDDISYTQDKKISENDYEAREKIVSNRFSNQNKLLENFDNILKGLEIHNKSASLINPVENNVNHITINKSDNILNRRELDADNILENHYLNQISNNENIDFKNFIKNEFFDLSKTYLNKFSENNNKNNNNNNQMQQRFSNDNFVGTNLINNSNLNNNLITNEKSFNNIDNSENSKSFKANKLIKNKYKNLIQNLFVEN